MCNWNRIKLARFSIWIYSSGVVHEEDKLINTCDHFGYLFWSVHVYFRLSGYWGAAWLLWREMTCPDMGDHGVKQLTESLRKKFLHEQWSLLPARFPSGALSAIKLFQLNYTMPSNVVEQIKIWQISLCHYETLGTCLGSPEMVWTLEMKTKGS